MAAAGAPTGDPTAIRETRWKARIAELEVQQATAELSRTAESAGLATVAKPLGVDLAAVTAAHADAYDKIETLVRERFEQATQEPTQ